MERLRDPLLVQPPASHEKRSSWHQELTAIRSGERLLVCHAALVLAYAVTASGIVYLKLSMNVAAVDSVAFSFWRFVGSTPLLLALAAANDGAKPHPTARSLAWLAVLGVLLVLNQLFSNLGVQLAGALIATVMQPFTPVVSAAMAVVVGQERLSVMTAAAFLLAVAGAVIVAAGRGESSRSQRSSTHVAAGFVCLLINTSSFAAYCVLMKKVVREHSAAFITGASQAIGMIVMGTIVLARETLVQDPPGLHLPPSAYGALAYWVVAISGGAYLLISWSNRHLPASTVALHNTAQPMVGAVLSVLCLGDHLMWTDLGGLGIVLGLVIVVWRPPAATPVKLPRGEPTLTLIKGGDSLSESHLTNR